MNYAMNWIQEDDFNLFHNMRWAKFSLLHSMPSAKCTIYEYSSICWKPIVLRGRMNVPGRCLLCMQTIGCMSEYFTPGRIFLQKINISDRIRFKTAQYCRFVLKFALACQFMEMLKRGWYHIHSHQHFSSSVLPRLCCPYIRVSVQIVQSASCIVLNLCFWFLPGLSQSLGFEPVTDVLPDSAARVLSACQELEKVAWNKLYLRQSLTACLGNCLPSVAFAVARERQQL